MNSMTTLTLVIATMGAGMMAGVYFAFSSFIMRSLDQLDGSRATNAMNAINRIILRSMFMPLFFGTSVLYLVLGVLALQQWSDSRSSFILGAALIYLCGMFLCTVFFNVPLNNQLAREADDSAGIYWAQYIGQWTRWNHVRAVSSLISCGLGIYVIII